jgi:predicted deacylase
MDALRLGKLSLGGEFGWGTAVNPFGVRCARHGILAAAIHHGQLRGSITPHAHHADGTQKVVSIGGTGLLHAPWPGLCEPLVECGARVRRGQPIAHLHDFHRIDDAPFELTADCDGFVLSLVWGASVRQGQICGVIASEIDLESR